MQKYKPADPVDVCIIGAALGGVMARLLAEAGLSVVVLDAGPFWNPAKDFVNDPWIMDQRLLWQQQTIYAGERGGPGERMPYGVGGSMNHWDAFTQRFRPSTFLAKSMQGLGDDWPITYEELLPYYQKTEKILGVAGDHTTYPVPREPFPLPPHPISYADQVLQKGFAAGGIHTYPAPRAILSKASDGRPACNYCGFCHSGCVIGAKANSLITHIPQAIKAGAEIRVGCYAREITVDKLGRAAGVAYFNSDGVEQEQKARLVVTAAGSPLSSRLLLLSKSKQFPNGLSNNHGQVGKNVWSDGGKTAAWGIYDKRLDSFRGLGTIASGDFFENDPKRDFVGGYTIMTAVALYTKLDQTLRIAAPGWGTELKSFIKDFYSHMVVMQAWGMGMVNGKNSVDLHPDAKDKWGLPLARVNVYRTDNDEAMNRHQTRIMTEVHRAAGAVKIFSRSGYGSADTPAPIIGGGDCRMGKDPKTSVLNPFCQSHEVKNLFVLGWSTMVTGAPTPFTLTLTSLTYRAAEYILKQKQDILAS